VAVSVTYTPTAPSGPGGDTSGLTVTGTDHRSVTVPVIGSAITGAPHLTISPITIDFGQTPVGESVTRAFDISNTGNIVLTITKAAPPTVPFAANNPIAEGQQLNPGDVIHQSITFAPSSVGAATGTYLITGNDGQGQQTVTFGGTGAQPSDVTIPAPDAGGWTFNGSAQLSGSDLVLTSAENNTAGSAVFGTPILSEGLRARFTAVIGGGTGADGLALVLLDPAKTSPQALGAGGGGLGYAGLPGVAVALDTFQNTDEPSSNFVGVATGGTGDTLTYAATSTAIGPLRTGTHTVGVDITTGTLMVTVDGTKVLSPTISLPPAVLIGFTGATGGLSDIHTARNVVITSPA
jgi:hypothetical protein